MAIIENTILSTDEYLEVYPQDSNVEEDIITGSINDATITLDAICGGMIAKVWTVIDPTDPYFRTEDEHKLIKKAHAIQAHEGVCRSVDFTGGSQSYTAGSNNFNESRTTPGVVADEIIYQLLAQARVYNPNITTDTTIASNQGNFYDPSYDPSQEYITIELGDNRYIHKHAEDGGSRGKYLKYDLNGNITYVNPSELSGYDPDLITIGLTENEEKLFVMDYVSKTYTDEQLATKARQTDLTAEITNRTNADSNLQSQINNKADQTALSGEIQARTDADNQLNQNKQDKLPTYVNDKYLKVVDDTLTWADAGLQQVEWSDILHKPALYTQDQTDALLNDKQNRLTAGTNINISQVGDELIISATTEPVSSFAFRDLTGSPEDNQALKQVLDSKATATDLQAETIARENADTNLQTQINSKANQNDLTQEITNRTNADTALGTRIDAIVPVITEITAHQTINTYEVPTLTVEQVQSLYNSVVAGRTTIIHFDPSDLGIDTDYVITQATTVSGVAIRFIYNDTMILTYTISGDNVAITYKEIGGGEQQHLYRHQLVNYRFSWFKIQLTIYSASNEPIDSRLKLYNYLVENAPNEYQAIPCIGTYTNTTTEKTYEIVGLWGYSGGIVVTNDIYMLYMDPDSGIHSQQLHWDETTAGVGDVITQIF